jgi:hypothetical protein
MQSIQRLIQSPRLTASLAGWCATPFSFILVLQYLRARRVRETREIATRYAAGFGIGDSIWIARRGDVSQAASNVFTMSLLLCIVVV